MYFDTIYANKSLRCSMKGLFFYETWYKTCVNYIVQRSNGNLYMYIFCFVLKKFKTKLYCLFFPLFLCPHIPMKFKIYIRICFHFITMYCKLVNNMKLCVDRYEIKYMYVLFGSFSVLFCPFRCLSVLFYKSLDQLKHLIILNRDPI